MKTSSEIHERLATLKEIEAIVKKNGDSSKTCAQLTERIAELERLVK